VDLKFSAPLAPQLLKTKLENATDLQIVDEELSILEENEQRELDERAKSEQEAEQETANAADADVKDTNSLFPRARYWYCFTDLVPLFWHLLSHGFFGENFVGGSANATHLVPTFFYNRSSQTRYSIRNFAWRKNSTTADRQC